MPDKPIFSFLIANYNNRAYAPNLLDSLQAQTFPSWEAVIVDDGSPDGGIGDMVAARRDARLHYIQLEKNAGAAHAWNLGFRESRGNLFPILGADDMLKPNYLEKVYEVFQSNEELSIVYVDLELFGAYHAVHALPICDISDLSIEQWLPHPGACVTREVMLASGGYYEGPELRYGNIDWDFWLSVVEHCPFHIQRIAEPLCLYRQHAQSMTKSRSLHEYRTRECMYRRHKAFFDSLGRGKSFVATGFFESSAAWWRKGNYLQAIELAIKGARLQQTPFPCLQTFSAPVAELARTVVALEKYFETVSSEAHTPTQTSLEYRLRLISCCLALRQWEKAEKHLCAGFGLAFRDGSYKFAAFFAVQLSLLFSELGRQQEAQQALALASLCDPCNLEALRLRFSQALAAGHHNEALLLFSPWLSVQDQAKLKQAAPYFSLLASLPGRELSWVGARLEESARSGTGKSPILPDCVYDLPLGRRLMWEFRARDLYERYGHTAGGHDALRQALEISKARCVLEIGCGNGRNLVLFSKLGLKSIGQDISANALDLAKKRNLANTTLICRPLSELNFQENEFDLVVCNRVLQHLTYDEISSTIDIIIRIGMFIYINESLPDDDYEETWYLKKYDFKTMMSERGMRCIAEISDSDVKHAFIFSK